MGGLEGMLTGAGAILVLYGAFVLVLVLLGRRSDARALAGFIPDCVVLLRRLMRDERIPRRRKALLWLVIGYLVMPIDLVPDFIPVAGQLDDAILVALGLRFVLRAGGPDVLRDHWQGPQRSLDLLSRLTFGAVVA